MALPPITTSIEYSAGKMSERVWVTTVDSRFRITFPKEFTDALSWIPGTKLCQTVTDGKLMVTAVDDKAEMDCDDSN